MQIKKRFVWMNILFCILTLGIYSIYWLYTLTEDSNKISPEYATASGGKAVLLSIFTFGIYGYYWHYKLGLKTYRKFKSGLMELLFYICGLGFLNYVLCQTEINTYADIPNDVPKKRNTAVCVLLSIVTLGIYFAYWKMRITEESSNICPEYPLPNGDTCHTFTLISLGFYRIYWAYKIAKKLNLSVRLCIALSFFPILLIVPVGLSQREINRQCEI